MTLIPTTVPKLIMSQVVEHGRVAHTILLEQRIHSLIQMVVMMLYTPQTMLGLVFIVCNMNLEHLLFLVYLQQLVLQAKTMVLVVLMKKTLMIQIVAAVVLLTLVQLSRNHLVPVAMVVQLQL